MQRALFFAVLLVGLTASAALAFPTTWAWHFPSSGPAADLERTTGAGGIYGTGGTQDHGVWCSSCHVEGDGSIDMAVVSSPPFADIGGELGYEPGREYTVSVELLGEHLREGYGSGMPGGESINGFGLAIEDGSGATAGRFQTDAGQDSSSCPPDDPGATLGATTLMYGDCHGVLFQPHLNLDRWTFTWTAPPAGSGELRMFVSVVDGNEIEETSLDDDVVERTFPLVEAP